MALTHGAETSTWSPARVFLLASAVWHLPLGIIGLAVDQTFPLDSEAAAHAGSAHLFGIFETNGWHSLAALFLGLVSVYFLMRPEASRAAALVIGVGHVGIVAALILWDPSTFLLASNWADQIVHSATAVGGIVSALMTRS